MGAVAIRADSGLGWLLERAPLRRMGVLSYAVYLLHITALGLVRRFLPQLQDSALWVFALGLAVFRRCFAELAARLLESVLPTQPLSLNRRRWRTQPAALSVIMASDVLPSPPIVPVRSPFGAAVAGSGCASEGSSQAPQAWSGFLHPPGPPGGSINNTKQCECRACDPASCCSAEKTESLPAASANCNDDYTFSEQCGMKIQTCTPRCYSHVWRVGKRESCEASRPLVCCE